MGKIKLTKGELKRQRDCLVQYERYLPILQLKKQQLQLEIQHQLSACAEVKQRKAGRHSAAQAWLGLLTQPAIDFRQILSQRRLLSQTKNIAGVDIPVFLRLDFTPAEYDLFITPLWVDSALESLKELVWLKEEIKVFTQSIQILRQELRITTQRVNLFEKIKIPQAQEAIRLIKIYIGDQMANAVGRSKMAKNKIEEALLAEVAA